MGRREQKKEENRNVILQSAKTVFIEKGYHNTSISDIIRQTGLARGTFYLYFQNKKEIFEMLIHKLFTDLMKDMKAIEILNRKHAVSYREDVKDMINSLLKTVLQHKELVKIFLNSPAGQDTEFDETIERYSGFLIESVKKILEKGQKKGFLRDRNATLISHIIIGGMKEIIFQWLVKDKMELDETRDVEEIVSFISDGMKI